MIKKKINQNKSPTKNHVNESHSVKKENHPFNQDIKHDLKHFIYGVIFGALLMLIFLRMLQLT